jgi:hypothetical protein
LLPLPGGPPDRSKNATEVQLADSVWEDLGADAALLEAVEDEKIRRVRDGSTKREKAQLLVTRAPDVLSGILLDATANPRHRIDSAKELNNFAANGPEAATVGAFFEIRIDLGADRDGKPVIEHYKKPLDAIDISSPSGTDASDDSDPDPYGIVAMIASNKRGSGGGGQSL